ncbi:MAG: hypothetical protein KGL39_11610 [Patescibacteria group bacterium]|nr:hypothetical protein [Patescibacteria group bacterium]
MKPLMDSINTIRASVAVLETGRKDIKLNVLAEAINTALSELSPLCMALDRERELARQHFENCQA